MTAMVSHDYGIPAPRTIRSACQAAIDSRAERPVIAPEGRSAQSRARRTEPTTDPTLGIRGRLKCEGFLGCSNAIADVLNQAAVVAPLDVDVLITGPSGTGKSALAQILANNSRRSDKPFVELNCAALPEALVESELFGAAAGSHSTATHRIYGKLSAAQQGTLFLDEVGELSLAVQAKLLQFLNSRVYYPLGAVEPVQGNVRVISATNADLCRLVAERRFRPDLFYRLHVVPIRMPELAERRQDIGLLVRHFVRDAAKRHQLRPQTATAEAIAACHMAPWPGNVRELANAVQAAVIRAHGEGSEQIDVHHLFPRRAAGSKTDIRTFQEATRLFQRELISAALERSDWNVSAAARELGLARSHVHNLIGLHGLQRSALD